jgi:di/tricarboxylate transporter
MHMLGAPPLEKHDVIDQLALALIILGLVWVLIFTRLPPSRAFVGAMVACYLLGFIDSQTVLSKSVNQGVVTLVLLLLVSVGLERLPWLASLGERLVTPSLPKSLVRLSLVTAVFSAFVNNTAVVATLASSLRKNSVHPASRLLLPLSYAAILGGTLTLIGTSTNLIVSSFVQDQTGTPLPFLAFFPVALPALMAGLLTMFLFSRRLPAHSHESERVEEYLLEAEIEDSSSMIGKTVQENNLRDLGGLFLVQIVRDRHLIAPVAPTQRIMSGDKLIFSGDIKRVALLERFDGLKLFALEEGLLQGSMTEVVIRPNAAIVGRTIKEVSFRSRFDAAVVGMKRDGERLSGKLGGIVVQPGDSLVLATGPDFLNRNNLDRNFLLVDTDIEGRSMPSGLSIGLTLWVGLMLTLVALSVLSLLKGLALTLGIMLLTGAVRTTELRRRFPWELWLIITSALAIAQAINNTGVVATLVAWGQPWLSLLSPLALLAAVYFLTLALTELMTNNAAAALMFPLAWALGQSAGVDPMPIIMSVAFGASASFLTPYGYTTNLMVQNLGGYHKRDYLRFGLPVSVAYSLTVLTVLPWAFPF